MSHEIKVNGYEPSKWPSRPEMNVDAHEKPAVHPDWGQNDEMAADYVKNRTHYSEISEEVIGVGYEGWAYVTKGLAVSIPKMSIAGIIYENVPVASELDMYVRYVVGNYLLEFDRMYKILSITPPNINKQDVKFIGPTEKVHKIPIKYIPTEDLPQSDWNEKNVSSASYIANKPEMRIHGIDSFSFTASEYIRVEADRLAGYDEVYISISAEIDNPQEGKSICITGQDQDVEYIIGYSEDLDSLKKPLIILHLYRKTDLYDTNSIQSWFGFAIITNNHLMKSMSVIEDITVTTVTESSNPYSGYLNINVGDTTTFKAGTYTVYGRD